MRHADVVAKIPGEAKPPPIDHGEHSYTVALVPGKMRKVCKIEVHVRNKAFRVQFPKLQKEEKPLVHWGGDVDAAWATAKEKATTKVDML